MNYPHSKKDIKKTILNSHGMKKRKRILDADTYSGR